MVHVRDHDARDVIIMVIMTTRVGFTRIMAQRGRGYYACMAQRERGHA